VADGEHATDAGSMPSSEDSGGLSLPTVPPIARDGGGIVDGGSAEPACGMGLMVLVSNTNEMYTLDPVALNLVDLGAFSCPGEPTPTNPATGSGVANSMAVDQNGVAWVNFQDGAIFQVDPATLACTATSFQPGQAGFTASLGMTFARMGDEAGSERLYVSDSGGLGGVGKGLAWIDTTTMTLNPIGPYTDVNAGTNAELAATPNGALFGLFSASPPNIAEISELTGATYDSTPLFGMSAGPPPCDPNAWVYMGDDDDACVGLIGESCGWTAVNEWQGYHCAMTSWGAGCQPGGATCADASGYAASFSGGKFWLFTASPTGNPDPTTTLSEYDPTTHLTTLVTANLGATIVGASASTCSQ
jgi:hypothetical protein